MSSKVSLFLTQDNEHCYIDCNERNFKDGEYVGDTITLEFDKKNIQVIVDNDDYLMINIKPGSELYELIQMMRN